MTRYQEVVLVHRRGRNPAQDARPEVATRDQDGRLYVRHNNRWWLLSNGASGWRSLNVGISDEATVSRLDGRSKPMRRLKVREPK